ncbi:hypothetical protein QBC37DRAFT_452104 [Rhypophila decipiens]|uniref:Uncharacterized protein n=1 Tax=Rhypophila decipiens TaxID=261697 RepID=A0AAN6YE54_9PEZI|nr:hypothetical protein QBC37DRAFT_452104 [Rhypophila decipiens]
MSAVKRRASVTSKHRELQHLRGGTGRSQSTRNTQAVAKRDYTLEDWIMYLQEVTGLALDEDVVVVFIYAIIATNCCLGSLFVDGNPESETVFCDSNSSDVGCYRLAILSASATWVGQDRQVEEQAWPQQPNQLQDPDAGAGMPLVFGESNRRVPQNDRGDGSDARLQTSKGCTRGVLVSPPLKSRQRPAPKARLKVLNETKLNEAEETSMACEGHSRASLQQLSVHDRTKDSARSPPRAVLTTLITPPAKRGSSRCRRHPWSIRCPPKRIPSTSTRPPTESRSPQPQVRCPRCHRTPPRNLSTALNGPRTRCRCSFTSTAVTHRDDPQFHRAIEESALSMAQNRIEELTGLDISHLSNPLGVAGPLSKNSTNLQRLRTSIDLLGSGTDDRTLWEYIDGQAFCFPDPYRLSCPQEKGAPLHA